MEVHQSGDHNKNPNTNQANNKLTGGAFYAWGCDVSGGEDDVDFVVGTLEERSEFNDIELRPGLRIGKQITSTCLLILI